MTDQQHIALLLHKYLQGSLTETETLLLENWKERAEANQWFFESLQNEDQLSRWISEDHPDRLRDKEENIYAKVLRQIPELRTVPLYHRSWLRVAVAASILFIGGLTYWLGVVNKATKTTDEIVQVKEVTDIEAPKITKATITLADGNTVSVDTLTALTQNNVQLSKTTDGQIVYSGASNEVVYNTLTNPRGSKVIDMTLSDGSHVWLNAGSSVTYPVAFMGNERKVAITGEAYFEVMHDANKPFYINKGNMSVRVLGTHFNVNAYDDEDNTKVTLLEGSVKVSNEDTERLLKPGQQAQVGKSMKVLNNVDVKEVMAWKNGKFSFSQADIKTVMRQLARWYDLDVEYKGEITNDLFWGDMQRDLPLSKVLTFLKKSQVHFNVEGKRIIVLP